MNEKKPEWDPRPEVLITAEERLTRHGAVKIASLWWSEPCVMGALVDGRTIIVSEPSYQPSDALTVEERQRAELLARVEDPNEVVWCEECAANGRSTIATTVALCCGRGEWFPACPECGEDFDHKGPEDCP